MTESDEKQLSEFIGRYPAKIYRKGEIIVFQGEAPRYAYVVEKGIIKAYNLSIHGDEKPVAFFEANEAFPGPWIYHRIPSSIYYYEVFSPSCSLRLISREDYWSFIRDNPKMTTAELDKYVNRYLALAMQLNALQHSRANEKLMYMLHYLALIHGRRIGKQTCEITLHMTHQDFANMTGLTRETAATELNKLKHQGLIDYDKQKPYIVNMTKLQAIFNDQYIAELEMAGDQFLV